MQRAQRALELEVRICSAGCPLPHGSKELFKQLRRTLLAAYRDERLETSVDEVHRLLKQPVPARIEGARNAYEIFGGQKDFGRMSDKGQFRRSDGALFNFALTVADAVSGSGLELLAYDFELRLPEGRTPAFVRFDFNLPRQANSDNGLRCHLHPGHDDLQAPSALMAPVELLELFLYGLRFRERRRT